MILGEIIATIVKVAHYTLNSSSYQQKITWYDR